MGVSRYRPRSRSFVPVIANVRPESSRVSVRVVLPAFVAGASGVRGEGREWPRGDHSESSGGVDVDAWASRRAIGGTA
jgi:hypothetical protein